MAAAEGADNSSAEAEKTLLDTFKPLPALNGKLRCAGIVDARKALRAAMPEETFIVNGIVTHGGAPLAGVAIDAGTAGRAVTDGSGRYTIKNLLRRKVYVLTPSKSGYSFSPPKVNVSLLRDIALNFKAAKLTSTVRRRRIGK